MASRKSSRAQTDRSVPTQQINTVLRRYQELNAEEKLLRERGNEIVTKKMWWAAGIGLLPLPLIDWAFVTGIQVALINDLADLFVKSGQPPVKKQTVRKWVTSLAGGFIPTYLKAVPIFGVTAGILTGPLFYGGVTYAIGKVFIQHFETGGTLLTFDADKMRGYFEYFLAEGREKLRVRPQEAA